MAVECRNCLNYYLNHPDTNESKVEEYTNLYFATRARGISSDEEADALDAAFGVDDSPGDSIGPEFLMIVNEIMGTPDKEFDYSDLFVGAAFRDLLDDFFPDE